LFTGFSSIPLRLIDQELNVIIPHNKLKDMFGPIKTIDILIQDIISDKNIIKF